MRTLLWSWCAICIHHQWNSRMYCSIIAWLPGHVGFKWMIDRVKCRDTAIWINWTNFRFHLWIANWSDLLIARPTHGKGVALQKQFRLYRIHTPTIHSSSTLQHQLSSIISDNHESESTSGTLVNGIKFAINYIPSSNSHKEKIDRCLTRRTSISYTRICTKALQD